MDVAKLAIDALRWPEVDHEEIRRKLIEMQDLIVSAQQSLAEAETENRRLEGRIADVTRYAELGNSFKKVRPGHLPV